MSSKTSTKLATAAGVGRTTLQRAEEVYAKSPERHAEVKAGTKTLTQALREMKHEEVVERLESIDAKKTKAIKGVYDVIVVDPPWTMQKIDRDVRPCQTGMDFSTMTVAEIWAMTLPCADNCHVWLWTTQRFLPDALSILAEWEALYVCTFVWHKPGGFQVVGLPQYNCEFALYGRRGSPEFVDTKGFSTCFAVPRGAHSEKPKEFYEMVARVTAGRRLDMFARKSHEGFDAWGKEAASNG
jgi:N6-adenosine-specific RNA methylase IME4